MINIAVLVSGGGTNLQALLDAQDNGGLGGGRIVLVVSSKPGVYALERAKNHGTATAVISPKDNTDFSSKLLSLMREYDVGLIVLAGYLSILPEEFISAYPNKIINVHPSLIPSFCGKGFYGLRVHSAVLRAGVKVTGATVHYVNEIPDGGEIIAQKTVDVLPDDTPESLQQRVMEQAEWVLLPRAVREFCAAGG